MQNQGQLWNIYLALKFSRFLRSAIDLISHCVLFSKSFPVSMDIVLFRQNTGSLFKVTRSSKNEEVQFPFMPNIR